MAELVVKRVSSLHRTELLEGAYPLLAACYQRPTVPGHPFLPEGPRTEINAMQPDSPLGGCFMDRKYFETNTSIETILIMPTTRRKQCIVGKGHVQSAVTMYYWLLNCQTHLGMEMPLASASEDGPQKDV